MSSLLNNASLLLNPAGSIISYQEDKIYSVLPKDGTGDFTFSGGDGGTRVNQQGYIETTPANLINQSEAIGSSPWILNDTSVTANSTVAPNGTTTADTIANNGNNAFHRVYQGAFTGYGSPQTMSFSLYIKYNNHQYFSFGLTDDSVYRSQVVVDLVNGTITQNFVNTGGDTLTSTITNVGGGWYYVTGTFTYATSLIGGNAYFLCMLLNQSTFTSAGYVGTGTSVFVWGAMFNTGGVKPYQPTTDRLNYPRITYQNGRGALLSEPQRTNTATYSEDLTNGVWSLNNVSITANNTSSPNSTQNADRVTRTNTSNTYFYNSNTTTSSNRANSIFLKKGTIDQATILGNSYSSGTYATFNLSNGTIISYTGCTPFIEQYKDGWYRCGIIQTNGVNYVLLVTLNGYNNDTVTSGEYLYAWGGQSELGTFPTSYIPTTSATVTRPLDQYSVTNLESKGLTGTNVGTLYLSAANTGIPYQGGTINAKVGGGGNFPYNYMILDNIGSANRVRIFNGGAQTAAYTYTEAFAKIAVTADGTNSSVFINGIKKGTSSGLLAGIEEITQEAVGAGLRYTTATYTIALSDSDAQTLTTVRSGSGGNISYYGPYTVHTFTGSATFTPSFNGEVEVLVVAGGGGGGFDFGGGGGAGGAVYASSVGVAQGTGITVTIGGGGVGGPPAGQSTSGGNSAFGGLTAIGGGGGANGSGANVYGLVKNGGSGGGAGGWDNALRTVSGSGIPGQGFDGGIGDPSTTSGGAGGGGGAGQKGQDSIGLSPAGDGGDGLPYSITGFSTYYAGGGGGGTYPGTSIAGVGGNGGGGNGAAGINVTGYSATSYTGGGGGGNSGGGGGSGGNGGSGIVIVRYLT